MANAMKLTLHLSAVDNMSRVVTGAMRNSQRAIQEAQARSLRVQQEARQNMLDAGMMMVGGAAALAYPLKMAANYERLRVQMNILTGSVAEGGRTFDSLLRLAKDTPLSLTEVAKAQTMMMGYGQSATAAASAIKMLGDVTSVTQGDLTGAIVAYGQAAQEGKMLTRDVRQFINAGVPAVSILQDMLGKDKNIFKMAEEGKITFDLLQEAMTRATSKGGMFADGLKIQANTLQGTWVKFTDVLDRTAAVFGESLVPAVKALLGALMPALENVMEFIKRNQSLAKVIMGGVVAFTALTASVFAFNAILWAATFTKIQFVKALTFARVGMLKNAFISRALAINMWFQTGGITAATSALVRYAALLSASIVPSIVAAVSSTYAWITSLGVLTTTIFNIPIIGWILAVVAGIAAIGVALYRNWDAVTGFFSKLWTGFKEFLPKAKSWGADLISSIKDGIVNAAPTLFAAVGKVVEFTRGFFPASPAKHGAFKDIHRIKIIEQVANTVKAGPLTNAIGRVTDTAMGAMGGGSSPMPAFAPVGGGGSVSVNYSPTINFGGGASEVERASLMDQLNSHKDEVARLVKDAMRSNERKRF